LIISTLVLNAGLQIVLLLI